MKHGVLTAALGFAILTGATLSHAADDGYSHGKGMGHSHGMGMAGPSFAQLDSDGDGKVTQDEMSAHRAARMAGFDTDGDGALSEDELRAGMAEWANARIEQRVSRMLEHHDADGDGKIGPGEMTAPYRGRMFERADTDGDGALSAEEFEAMRARHHGKG